MIGTRGLTTILSAALLGVALGPAPARAAEGELMRDAMSSIGLIEPERPAINYNERAPLVMPPSLSGKGATGKNATGKGAAPKAAAKPRSKRGKGAEEAEQAAAPEGGALMSLPPPQSRQADPQWPKDPEIVQRERAAAASRAPSAAGAQGRMNDNNMTLSPGEMAAGGRRAGTDAPGGHRGEREGTWLDPLQLLLGRKEASADDAAPVEPARDILTDPPTGYRKAPARVAKEQGLPVGNSISGNEEADPRTYMREQNRR